MIAPRIAFKLLPTSCGLSNGQESKNMISLCHGNLRSNHLVLNVNVEEDHLVINVEEDLRSNHLVLNVKVEKDHATSLSPPQGRPGNLPAAGAFDHL